MRTPLKPRAPPSPKPRCLNVCGGATVESWAERDRGNRGGRRGALASGPALRSALFFFSLDEMNLRGRLRPHYHVDSAIAPSHGLRSPLPEKLGDLLGHFQAQLRAPPLAGPAGQPSGLSARVGPTGTRTSQPSCIIHSMTSQWPPSAAQCRAVQPPRSLVSQEAPCLRRHFTTSRCPA